MTNKIFILTGVIGIAAALTGCEGVGKPGRVYMPDMTYSRAYETYAPTEERLDNSSVEGHHPFYNNKPVTGTIARGDLAEYPLKNDSAGYAQSAFVKNPLDSASIDLKNAERLYLINCAICHGAKLDGNGPLFNDGNGPYTAAPKNFLSAEMKEMPEGRMFHSATYGKGQMGSYASQLNTKQRWTVIAYIKSKQGAGAAKTASDSTKANGAAPAGGSSADSTKAAK
ncbi:MAG: cytochrome c [Chitinophagaceae bacterium]